LFAVNLKVAYFSVLSWHILAGAELQKPISG